MQGAFAAHEAALRAAGAEVVRVRTAEQLEGVQGIVIPGGESTAIRKAMRRTGLLEPLRRSIDEGLPAFGTCAGLIVLARAEGDDPKLGAPPCFGLLDVTVERNGFGAQVHSFEAAVEVDGQLLQGVFIRAPRLREVGAGVEVVGRLANASGAAAGGEPVAVQQRSILAASFHPELGHDLALHQRFLTMISA